MMVRRPHIRQPCSTQSSSLRRKNGSGGANHFGSLQEPLVSGSLACNFLDRNRVFAYLDH